VPNPESYELFFEWQMEDGWLVFGGGSSISVYKKYSTMQTGSDDNMTECEMFKWKTEGSYDYYFVYDENAYNTDFGHTYYVVKGVAATNAIADVYSCTRWSTGDLPGTLFTAARITIRAGPTKPPGRATISDTSKLVRIRRIIVLYGAISANRRDVHLQAGIHLYGNQYLR
jgi:hypothetical protein